MIQSLKEAWEEFQINLATSINEIISAVARDDFTKDLKIPMKQVDWSSLTRYQLDNSVILSGDVGLHVLPDQKPVVMLTAVKFQSKKTLLDDREALFFEGPLSIGVDLIFSSKNGAKGKFINIHSHLGIIFGEKVIQAILNQSVLLSGQKASTRLKTFVSEMTVHPDDNNLLVTLGRYGEEDEFLGIFLDTHDLSSRHVVIGSENTVLYIGPNFLAIKDLDKALITLSKSVEEGKPRLEIYITEH